MSEFVLTMWAQKMGINVYHGVDVGFEIAEDDAFDTSTNRHEETTANSSLNNWRTTDSLRPPRVVLKDSSRSIGTHVNTKLVCDATGFSRKLTSKFGKKEKLGKWNCDAYWAYFKEKDVYNVESRLDHWDYPATKHICFPEGLGWFIKLISWHQAPVANLMDLVAYVIDNAKSEVPIDEFPCTKDLSNIFHCPYEFITSIGFAVRDDYKLPENLDEYGDTESERKFTYFQRKYPTFDRLLNQSYDLLPKYYGERTYFVRKSMAFQSPIVAGEGWLAIGNSAGFTNPLISPGINAGIGSAFFAATLTEKILRAPEKHSRVVMQSSAEIYQTYVHDFMMPRLHQMNCLWYDMFRDHRLFEAIIRCFWSLSLGYVDTHYGDRFTAKDLKWLVGAGGDDFQ
jgi:flavin-dependent dehydrogenase